MNRDDLIELCLGDVEDPATYRQIEEPDDDNQFVVHTRAVIGTRPRRYVVRREFAPGAGIGEAATTLITTEIMWVCVDPDHRGKGYARDLIAGVAEEAASHKLMLYLTANASGFEGFMAHFGFVHPQFTPPGFVVFALTDEPWPPGRIMR